TFFAPPSRQGSILLPGFDGGGEWGGAAGDPGTGTLVGDGSAEPWIAARGERAHRPANPGTPRSGRAVYAAACAACHGTDRGGRDRAPSLIGLSGRLSQRDVRLILDGGRGFMPSFAGLPLVDKAALLEYLGYAVAAADTAV